MNATPTLGDLAAALARAQAQMEPARKDSVNPHFHSKYADLASVVEAIRQPFADNGLSYVQLPVVTSGEEVAVETVLLHASGQWISSVFAIPVARNDAHGHMSALTYCRRGALAAIAGVAPDEDDDGNQATAAAPARPETAPAARTCPACGKDAIIKGKAEYGGGWLCFGKRGGCGAKWPEGPFPTAPPPAPLDATANLQRILDDKLQRDGDVNGLFPDESTDANVLVGKIQARWDKLGTSTALRRKTWERRFGPAAFLSPGVDVAALTDLLHELGV